MPDYKLSHLKTNYNNSQGRLFDSAPSEDFRTSFQRDRDRIIHTASFRRLKHKTQVFVSNEGDFYRTRLTHSIEVSQIARSICNALGLDIDLAEAIALAHDLGHPPFGHSGEDALNLVMTNYGGFDHNAQTIKILTKLEKKYPDFEGLNLSWETLEGIAKHNGPLIGKLANKDKKVPEYILEYDKKYCLNLDEFPALEAQIASLADDIAYCCHDIEDGIKAKLFTTEQICEFIPALQEIYNNINHKYPALAEEMMLTILTRELLKKLVYDLIQNTYGFAIKNQFSSPIDVRKAATMTAQFSQEAEQLIKSIKTFLMNTVYRHFRVNRMSSKSKMIVKELFEYFMNCPECMPNEWGPRGHIEDLNKRAEIVADFIAGMTDNFAIKEYNSIFNPNDKLLSL
ncbi:deoxyguanosinetriphosphate triphosphohydrolase [Rickettsiales endosymbiont of Stachyamoeba lipophora]|uniref:deoxyguanosinetriphosphate triphosphohydrolase n=1 Tax=Rickettsiales endosymbiont of Stachyamoeba lipophora TaxID=2486578 RepID=UPI000F64CBF7|nr:deoxyguanosinetriphosphate triphosphohydrolase [Rickettsiales endosymbiont of Stachyamoeba lipophora]AZL15355.1 deoxyguanosinetriphosphate triphosphohydrolase [Rickettsiales endosymbiont of Stachyamoeba lipophora]